MACCWSWESIRALEFHNYEAIIEKSDSKIDTSSKLRMYKQLRAGIFMNGRKQKFWLDKKNKNCFMIFAEGLEIAHSQRETYWKWKEEETRKCLVFPQSDGAIKLAELIRVWWLEAKGSCDAAFLSPDATYEVVYVIKLRQNGANWKTPVNFALTLPGGKILSHEEVLETKEIEKWHRIWVGEFDTTPENNKGTIKFSLEETSGGLMTGLVIKGVIIQPKI